MRRGARLSVLVTAAASALHTVDMQTSMRVAQENRDRLARIAESELGGATLDDALRVLLFEHESRRALARLAADPEMACELPNDLVFVVPCTTKDRGLPFQPRLNALGKPSFAMCDQLKSISHGRLVKRHSARLDKSEIEAVRFALRRLIEV